MLISIAVSVAEILDRITINEVKLKYIRDPAKIANIENELGSLRESLCAVELPHTVRDLVEPLRASNDENFSQIEIVFECEAQNAFGERYVRAARAAFVANAERARIKRKINLLMNSEILEEKTY